jgi:uncharacterized membrane protein (UPF0127 family)
MVDVDLAPRLRPLPTMTVLGFEVPVATGVRARLLGLAHLDRGEAGAGLLIPRCRSVHTFGMRFALDVHFLDEGGEPVAICRGIGARRVVSCRKARAVLEIPAGQGGEFSSPSP